jgi:hypothetical protein
VGRQTHPKNTIHMADNTPHEKDPARVAAGQHVAETLKAQDPQHFEKIGAMGGQAKAANIAHQEAHDRGVKAAETVKELYGPDAHKKIGAGETVKPAQ